MSPLSNLDKGRRLFLIGLSSLALASCGSLLGPGDAPQIYVLRPTLPPAQAGAKVSWALSISQPDSSDALDSERIALAKTSTQFDYYANATWPDHLTDLVQTALLAGFEASGRIDAVAREEDALHADYDLSTDVRNFEAHYATPDGVPTVAVTIIAHMVETHSRKVVADLTVTLTEPASANSVDAVVQAFDVALAKAVTQITQWALALPPPTPLSGAADITASKPPPRGRLSTPSQATSRLSQAPGGNELPLPGSATPPAP